jgi:excisionase family DNA binding protein
VKTSDTRRLANATQPDPRIASLCDHLRSAIDILEEIATQPARFHEPPIEAHPAAPSTTQVSKILSEKLAYTIKEVAATLGVSKSTLYLALGEGDLKAIKLGHRTLIPSTELQRRISSLPSRASSPA